MQVCSPDQAPKAEAQDTLAAEMPLYDLLQVVPTAEPAVIRAAYEALTQSFLAEQSSSPAAAEARQALNRAHAILSNPRRRAMYDLKLRAAQRLHHVAVAHGLRRQTTCWRCQESIDPLVRYCGECHWLACPKCRACGCEHPEWRRRTAAGPKLGLLVGWTLAVIFALCSATLLANRPQAGAAQQVTAPTAGRSITAPAGQSPAARSNERPAASQLVIAVPTVEVMENRLPVVGQAPAVAPPAAPTPVVPPPPLATTADSAASGPVAVVATQGQGARLRAESNVQAPILEVLRDGTRLTEVGGPVMYPDRTWRQVLAPSGKRGWVDAGLLELPETGEVRSPVMLAAE